MFKARTTLPQKGNPYYNTRGDGGISPCIRGNWPRQGTRTGWEGLTVCPNCVGLACGRFNEIIGSMRYPFNMNAKDFIGAAKRWGLEITKEPTLGGIMVWGHTGAGHVAVVEEILPDGVKTLESGWKYKVPCKFAIHKRSPEWTQGSEYYWMGIAYKYLGCIKNPAVADGNLIFNGKKYTVELINKNHTNYIKLRDLDDTLRIGEVKWNQKEKLPELTIK